MPVSKKQQGHVNKYIRNNYDRISITTEKGKKDKIKTFAEKNGESLNGFINRLIDEAMGQENENDDIVE